MRRLKISLILSVVLALGAITVFGAANTCRVDDMADFRLEKKGNGRVEFTPCHPERFDYYKWTFGDNGYYATHQDFITHTYQTSGTFKIRMKARNVYGNWVKTYHTVEITHQGEGVNNVSFLRRIERMSAEVKIGIGVGIVVLIMLM